MRSISSPTKKATVRDTVRKVNAFSTHRQTRHDVIGEMGGGLDHAPGIARGAHAAPLARVRDQEVVSALAAPGTGKTWARMPHVR